MNRSRDYRHWLSLDKKVIFIFKKFKEKTVMFPNYRYFITDPEPVTNVGSYNLPVERDRAGHKSANFSALIF
jgi:hypothetical protein